MKIPHICYSFYFYIFYYTEVERQLAYFCKNTTLPLDDDRKKKHALSITVNTETEYISLCSSIHMRNKNINVEWLIILRIENTVLKLLHYKYQTFHEKDWQNCIFNSILHSLSSSMFSNFELFFDSTLIKMP